MATRGSLRDGKTIWDGVLHELDVRNEADSPICANEVLKGLQHLIERARIIVSVQAAKALIDKDRIQTYFAANAFHNIREAKR